MRKMFCFISTHWNTEALKNSDYQSCGLLGEVTDIPTTQNGMYTVKCLKNFIDNIY